VNPLPLLPRQPRVGVVMATHNHERFLEQALESVFAQTYPRELVDVVVVDDGSTDRTPEILARHADRIAVVRQENRGHLAAYDRGLAELGEVDLIALFDGDDLWPERRLSSHVEAFRANPAAGLVYGDLEWIDEEGGLLRPSHFRHLRIDPPSGRIAGALLTCNYVGCGPTTVRACLRDRFQPIPQWARAQDWWIAYRVAEVAEAVYLPEVATSYRRHGGNLSAPRNLIGLRRREIPFRRWLLGRAKPENATAAELLSAIRELGVAIAEIAAATGETPADLVVPTPAEREAAHAELAAGRRALDGGARTAAIFSAAHALALDPGCAPAGAIITAAVAGAPQPADPRGAGRRRLETRLFVVAARVEDLAASPELLRAYCTAFAGAQATLAVVGEPGEVEAALVAAGFPAADDVDVLAIGGAESLLAEQAHALLADAPVAGPLSALPHHGSGDLPALLAACGAHAAVEPLSVALLVDVLTWDAPGAEAETASARALQNGLLRSGHNALVLPVGDWYSAEARSADVAVRVGDGFPFPPAPGQPCLRWTGGPIEALLERGTERAA